MKTIKYKNKEFRIYKWEFKPFRDFKIPKGFELTEHKDFMELFDNKLIDYPKEGWEVYFVKHYSKRKQKEGYISGLCLYRNSGLVSWYEDLADSNISGRVVVSRRIKE